MSETNLIPVDMKEKIKEALSLYESIKEVVGFNNDEEYDNGMVVVKDIKKTYDLLEGKRKELASPHFNKFKEINDEFSVVKMLQEKEKIFKNAISKYYSEREQKRIAEQRRLEAEAEEKRRQELAKAQREQEKANQYREYGRDDMAYKAEARAEVSHMIAGNLVPPTVENTAKVKGTSFRTVWKVKVNDKNIAADFCLNNTMLKQYVSIDEKGIEKLANAMKGELKIAGIEIYPDTQVSIRS